MKLKTLILAACFAIMAVVTMTPTESLAQAVCQPGTVNYSTGREPCTPCRAGSIIPRLVRGCALDVRLGLIARTDPLIQRNALRVHSLGAMPGNVHPALRASTLRRALVPADTAPRASTLRRVLLPAYPAPRERMLAAMVAHPASLAAQASPLNRELLTADPAVQAPTLRREAPPAPPAQAAREALPAAAPA